MDVLEKHPDPPTEAEQHLDRAYAHQETEDFETALRECESAIQRSPNLAEAHNLRGIILEELGRRTEAIASYREAVRLDPTLVEALENLSEAEAELREANRATASAPRAWADQDSEYRLSIDTPENVVFGYEVAGIGSRFLAALIDTLLIVVLQAIVGFTMLFLIMTVGGTTDWDDSLLAWSFVVLGLIAFAFLWGYYVFFEMIWNGQSPGKRQVGLRVIRTDGTPTTFAESLIRNLVRLVDFLPAYYGIGVVTMFIDRQSRRLGDLAAGTLVVRDRGTVTLESLKSRPAWSTPGQPTATGGIDLPVERLSSRDIEMAEDFLRRRDQLSNPTAVANHIAQALLERMGVAADQIGIRSASHLILRIVQASHSRESE